MNLLELRKKLGFNKAEMAKFMKMSRPTYYYTESGKRKMKRDELELMRQIAQRLKNGERIWKPEPSNEPLASTTSKQVKLADGLYTIYTTIIYVKH